MNFGCWNVQGISTKNQEVFKTLADFNIDIAVLSETKKKGNGNEFRDNYIHFYSGVDKDKRARAGISIALNKKFQKDVRNWSAINERLITMDLEVFGHKLILIGVYAPTDDATADIKDSFFEKLTSILDTVGNRKDVVLMGDFNGRIGKKTGDRIVGQHGEDVINDNGVRLIEVCHQYDLKIMNGFFDHKEIHKYTWFQPTKRQQSIIDYIIVKPTPTLKVQDVKVQRGASCGSDHYLVRAKLFFSFKHQVNKGKDVNEPNQVTQWPKYNLDSLFDESTRFLYKIKLANKMRSSETGTIEEQYNFIKTCIHEAANEALGQKDKEIKRKNDVWWNDSLEHLVSEKKIAYHKWLATQDPEDRKSYMRCNYEVKKEKKKAMNKFWERKCDEMDRLIGSSKSRQAWKTIRTLKNNTREVKIIDPIGIDNWKKYYQALLNEDRNNFKEVDYTSELVNQDVREVTIEEVIDTVKYMKNNKAAGPGGMPIELIKNSPIVTVEAIARLFTDCLEGGEVPEEWKIAYVSSIHKKGSKMKCENYRGISVTSSMCRLYGRILKSRIEKQIKDSEEQSGFRPGRSCVDNTFCLKQLAEKSIAHGRELHIIFIDLKKAYDSVPVKQLWQAMKDSGIQTNYINAVKQLYKDNISRVKIGNNYSDEFIVNKGLRQGCCISPTLFKVYINRVLRDWRRKCMTMGVLIEEQHIYSLEFADDQVILAEDGDDVNYMFRKLKEEYTKWGLEINMGKTEYMVIGGQGEDLIIDNDVMKKTNEYKYLGVTITSDGKDEIDIQNKIKKGKTIIRQLHPMLWNDNISNKTKIRMFNSFVESCVTYGSEVWTLNEKMKNKILATEMMYWRRCCKKTLLDHERNERIREIMQVETSLINTIERKQLLWYGHMRRMNQDRIPQKIWKWSPANRRKRGRPRKSWEKGIKEAMLKRGLEEDGVRDRISWKLGCGRWQS